MDKHTHGNEVLRALKARAGELQNQAIASGSHLKRSMALEEASRERGFRDWNAASAAAKRPSSGAAQASTFLWRDLDSALPSLPFRIHPGDSRFYHSIRELMRWAQQLELIAETVPEDSRSKMLQVVGGDVPYVFVQNRVRWSDDLYRLCDRGYEPWAGIAFTHDELALAGVIDWEAEHGSHGGGDMYSLAHDDMRTTSNATALKRLARLLAGVALVADQAFERDPDQTPNSRINFTIDLKVPKQVTAANVARLLRSKDDSAHRQVRVTTDGIAYLSDVVGNNELVGLAFRLETWIQGNGYVGKEASLDEDWVKTVLELLRENWPKPKANLVDW